MIARSDAWSLVVDRPGDGAWNMAVDEALLDAAPAAPGPTLRLYGFEPPALSLGRSQAAAGAYDPRFLEAHGIDLVRRPTGGLAVLHEHERTYAVVGRLDRPPFDRGVVETYRAIARAVELALRSLGIAASADAAGEAPDPRRLRDGPSCFSSATAHEIVVGPLKLVGAAQLRRREAFLQHGTILVRSDATRHARAFGQPRCAGFTDVERELGHPFDEARLDAALIEAMARTFGTPLVARTLDDAERSAALRLCRDKYASPDWTLHARSPR